MKRIRQGLKIPISGAPQQEITSARSVSRVAVVADDYIGMKPTMVVAEGDYVKQGQLLFTDKKSPGINYTSPGCGQIIEINRGLKRIFQSIVIELAEHSEEETFTTHEYETLATLTREQVCNNLIQSGLWTSFRTRPYSKIPAINSEPHSIFITAIDTNPLSADVQLIIKESERDFKSGLQIIQHLTAGKLYLCKEAGVDLPGDDLKFLNVEEFSGPHPAGLVGTHIHLLDPVSSSKTVWHVNYQDVIAIGHLFLTGKLKVERVISLGGPAVKHPRLLRTRMGADLGQLVQDELNTEDARVISGSVLSGRKAEGPFGYLGRFDLQVSVVPEQRDREFLGWQQPGFNQYSSIPVFISSVFGLGKDFTFTTATHGSPRAMVPIGMFEKVMPLDILPTFLLRALLSKDSDRAQELGCLELDEEDLALCTFVCPGKTEYGPLLRETLTLIERDG